MECHHVCWPLPFDCFLHNCFVVLVGQRSPDHDLVSRAVGHYSLTDLQGLGLRLGLAGNAQVVFSVVDLRTGIVRRDSLNCLYFVGNRWWTLDLVGRVLLLGLV